MKSIRCVTLLVLCLSLIIISKAFGANRQLKVSVPVEPLQGKIEVRSIESGFVNEERKDYYVKGEIKNLWRSELLEVIAVMISLDGNGDFISVRSSYTVPRGIRSGQSARFFLHLGTDPRIVEHRIIFLPD